MVIDRNIKDVINIPSLPVGFKANLLYSLIQIVYRLKLENDFNKVRKISKSR